MSSVPQECLETIKNHHEKFFRFHYEAEMDIVQVLNAICDTMDEIQCKKWANVISVALFYKRKFPKECHIQKIAGGVVCKKFNVTICIKEIDTKRPLICSVKIAQPIRRI